MEAVYKRRLRRRGEDRWYKMKKNRIISGVILFISAAAILLYGTGPVIGLVKKLGYLGEDGKILMRLEDENISASVQKSFTVPLGGEGMITGRIYQKKRHRRYQHYKEWPGGRRYGHRTSGTYGRRKQNRGGAGETGRVKDCIRKRYLYNQGRGRRVRRSDCVQSSAEGTIRYAVKQKFRLYLYTE